MTRLEVNCPICMTDFDWHRGYGRDCRCCCKGCHDEFNLRYARSILNKPSTQPEPVKQPGESQ